MNLFVHHGVWKAYVMQDLCFKMQDLHTFISDPLLCKYSSQKRQTDITQNKNQDVQNKDIVLGPQCVSSRSILKHTGLHKKYEDLCIFQHLHFLKLLTYFMNSTYSHTLSKLNVFSSLWVHAKGFWCFTFAFWESMIFFHTNKLYPKSSWTKENIKTKKDRGLGPHNHLSCNQYQKHNWLHIEVMKIYAFFI